MAQIFQKALIPVERPELFNPLRSAIQRVFAADCVERFLKRLVRSGVSIRNFQDVLDKRVLEAVDQALKDSGQSARSLYDALPVSDQAQMRELYLTALESVEQGVREKYAKIYRYY
jgi:pyruvate/oxaloacetate carboxyltransferase